MRTIAVQKVDGEMKSLRMQLRDVMGPKKDVDKAAALIPVFLGLCLDRMYVR
jgi:hypothetical protein